MATSQEQLEYTGLEEKHLGAAGSRDVLILVSNMPEDPQVMPRKKGELTQQDKDKLTSEGIPSECWEDDAKIMKERYLKNGSCLSVVVEDAVDMRKKHVLDKIDALIDNTTAEEVVLHYIGSGKKDTGDWCFIDGYISFNEILNLYIPLRTETVLGIHADCSYSGQWVEKSKDFLDEAGVQPCGHSAREMGIKLKLFSSCQPNQIGSTLIYSARGHENDKSTGKLNVFAQKELAPDQTACGQDFTEITCKKPPDEICALSPKFTFQEKKNTDRLYLVLGKVQERPVWHYMMVVDDPETIQIFKEKTQGENAKTQSVNFSDYGLILKSGWGQEPSQEAKDWAERVKIGLEDLQYT